MEPQAVLGVMAVPMDGLDLRHMAMTVLPQSTSSFRVWTPTMLSQVGRLLRSSRCGTFSVQTKTAQSFRVYISPELNVFFEAVLGALFQPRAPS